MVEKKRSTHRFCVIGDTHTFIHTHCVCPSFKYITTMCALFAVFACPFLLHSPAEGEASLMVRCGLQPHAGGQGSLWLIQSVKSSVCQKSALDCRKHQAGKCGSGSGWRSRKVEISGESMCWSQTVHHTCPHIPHHCCVFAARALLSHASRLLCLHSKGNQRMPPQPLQTLSASTQLEGNDWG